MKRNIPSVQVKNKPCVGGTKHAFILDSMDSMVANKKSPPTVRGRGNGPQHLL